MKTLTKLALAVAILTTAVATQSGMVRGYFRTQAWREAQLELLRSKDFSNPYFWAAFTLTGQWRE